MNTDPNFDIDFDEFTPSFPDTPPEPISPDPTEEPAEETEEPMEGLKDYFEILKTQGVIRTPEDFEFDGTPAKFEEAITHTKEDLYNEIAEELFERLPDDFKPLLDYALKGGTSLQTFLSAHAPVEVTEKDLTTEEGQRKILFTYYKETSNYSDDKIKRIIARLDDPDELEEEAKTTLVELAEIKEEKRALLAKTAAEEAAEKQRQAEQKINAIKKSIDDADYLDDTRRNKVKSFFLNQLKIDGKPTTGFAHTINQILSSPQHAAQLADIIMEYDPKKGISLDRFEKRVNTKKTQSMKALLQQTIDARKGGDGKIVKSKQDFDWEQHFYNS